MAVRNLSLEVAPGQVYGLLGPNGSGKSTTMKIVLGLISPSAGSTEIFGRDSQLVDSHEEVGFLPENPYFYKYLTGTETLRFYGKLCGLSGSTLRDKAADLLRLVGLEHAARPAAGRVFQGMLQRVGLAQALIQDPRLLVLDEPTAGVDPRGSAEIRDLIVGCKERGITVLLCSHLLGQVQEICDRVGILNHGVLVREGRIWRNSSPLKTRRKLSSGTPLPRTSSGNPGTRRQVLPTDPAVGNPQAADYPGTVFPGSDRRDG